MRLCLSTKHLIWNTTLGGHAWVFLNWALGLQACGAEIVFLERAQRGGDAEASARQVRAFRERVASLGLDARVALLPRDDAPLPAPLAAETIALDELADTAELMLNFRYPLGADVVGRFARTVLVDIDPGLLQYWIQVKLVTPAPHDLYVTTGETVGHPGAGFPDCGVAWFHVPPPVHLPSWPVCGAAPEARYTTVTNWWGEYEIFDGTMVNNEKRTEFLAMIGLPSRVAARIELAIYQATEKNSDIPLLRDHGWHARPAHEVSATPDAYRRYIQRSRGEFSCAKRSCMHFANAWISDRTLCYLASGKPAIAQHTGESRLLPDDEGLLRFRDEAEAIAAFERVEADYDHHAAAARRLAETTFDARAVAERVLGRAMAIA